MRGLKFRLVLLSDAYVSRIPCGMRGLKFFGLCKYRQWTESHSLRNAWIEIRGREGVGRSGRRRIPCGMRGLKYQDSGPENHEPRRIPCGMRGLK